MGPKLKELLFQNLPKIDQAITVWRTDVLLIPNLHFLHLITI